MLPGLKLALLHSKGTIVGVAGAVTTMFTLCDMQVQRLESSEAAATAAAEAAQQQLRESNRARLAATAAAAETGSSSDVLAGRVAQLESQVEQCRDETRDLSHQVDALQV